MLAGTQVSNTADKLSWDWLRECLPHLGGGGRGGRLAEAGGGAVGVGARISGFI